MKERCMRVQERVEAQISHGQQTLWWEVGGQAQAWVPWGGATGIRVKDIGPSSMTPPGVLEREIKKKESWGNLPGLLKVYPLTIRPQGPDVEAKSGFHCPGFLPAHPH